MYNKLSIFTEGGKKKPPGRLGLFSMRIKNFAVWPIFKVSLDLGKRGHAIKLRVHSWSQINKLIYNPAHISSWLSNWQIWHRVCYLSCFDPLALPASYVRHFATHLHLSAPFQCCPTLLVSLMPALFCTKEGVCTPTHGLSLSMWAPEKTEGSQMITIPPNKTWVSFTSEISNVTNEPLSSTWSISVDPPVN